jgi:hypothetical protein
MKSFRMHVTFRGGRKETIESYPDRYTNVDDMLDEMTTTTWYRHTKGVLNMLEVESVNPTISASVGDPRRAY